MNNENKLSENLIKFVEHMFNICSIQIYHQSILTTSMNNENKLNENLIKFIEHTLDIHLIQIVH